jgi:two-component system LytT family response regulator
MARIRTLIVDDEPLARQRLRALLENEPDIEVIGECAGGKEAVASIRERAPDLVFLDVQMPSPDGFGVIEEVGADRMPAVVFVTAFDRHALRAFEVQALDYLLKPFDRERFGKALNRARAQVERARAGDLGERLTALLDGARAARKPAERLIVKSAGRVVFLRADEVDWVEAAGNYLRLHVGTEVHLLRETMSGLETRLDPDQFLRIHRSTMVNVERIKEIQPLFHGDCVVILRDGTELTLSRGYRSKLERFLGGEM